MTVEKAYISFNLPRWEQVEHRIKCLMTDLGMPNSTSLYVAMGQLVRDVEHIDRNTAPAPSAGVLEKEGAGCDRAEVIEKCAAIVDQCNREGPYQAIGAAARIRAFAAQFPATGKGWKFQLGDRVTKIKGSSWTGRVVGFYSTALTPVGYAVESETETGSVQIYPQSALVKKDEKNG